MLKIIGHAVYQKVLHLKELAIFQRDFLLLTGLNVHFVDDLGHAPSVEQALPAFCGAIQASDHGRRMCQTTCRGLLEAAATQGVCMKCDAGLMEAAVPVRISGVTAGHLRVFGFTTVSDYRADHPRIRHLLARMGIDATGLGTFATGKHPCYVSEPHLEACMRLLQMAAVQLAAQVTSHLITSEKGLPPLVAQACQVIRRGALTQAVRLDAVARACGVSPSHLSRVFHQTTGLTFSEYVARCRAEHARDLLLQTRTPITRIAFQCGFRSLSQFNRAFRAVYDKTPRQVRRDGHDGLKEVGVVTGR